MMVLCIFHPGVWTRKWQPTPVFLLGKSHGQKSLVGYSSWGHKESDTIEWLNNTETPWNKPNSKLKQREEGEEGEERGEGKEREERGEMLSKQGYRKKRETGRVWSYCSFSGWICTKHPSPVREESWVSDSGYLDFTYTPHHSPALTLSSHWTFVASVSAFTKRHLNHHITFTGLCNLNENKQVNTHPQCFQNIKNMLNTTCHCYTYTFNTCICNGCKWENLYFWVGLGSKGRLRPWNPGLPERMDSGILLHFLILFQVYFHGAPNFSEHSHISHFTVSVDLLLSDQRHSSDPPLLFTDFQMNVTWHGCIGILVRLGSGEDWIHCGLGDLHSTCQVLLDRWAPDLERKDKVQCEGMTSDLIRESLMTAKLAKSRTKFC